MNNKESRAAYQRGYRNGQQDFPNPISPMIIDSPQAADNSYYCTGYTDGWKNAKDRAMFEWAVGASVVLRMVTA